MKTNDLSASIIISLLFSLLVAACSKEDDNQMAAWKTIETNIFYVDVPDNWTFIDLHGIDTYNGLLTGNTDSMKFDYGLNLDTFSIDPDHFSFHYETVNGKRVKILEGKDIPQIYGMAIDSATVTIVNVDSNLYAVRKFIMMQSSTAQMDKGTAMKMLRSVRFK